jgi:hypothetical protein
MKISYASIEGVQVTDPELLKRRCCAASARTDASASAASVVELSPTALEQDSACGRRLHANEVDG